MEMSQPLQRDHGHIHRGNYVKVSDHQLATKFRSKKDLYTYMNQIRKSLLIFKLMQIVQYYMPPIDTINKDFIKQVLAD